MIAKLFTFDYDEVLFMELLRSGKLRLDFRTFSCVDCLPLLNCAKCCFVTDNLGCKFNESWSHSRPEQRRLIANFKHQHPELIV